MRQPDLRKMVWFVIPTCYSLGLKNIVIIITMSHYMLSKKRPDTGTWLNWSHVSVVSATLTCDKWMT